MIRNSRARQALRNRLLSAQGHMGAIEKMISDDAPFPEVLHQMLAVRGALSAIQRELWRTFLLDEKCGLQSEEEEERVRTLRDMEAVLVGTDPSEQDNKVVTRK